MTLDMTTPVERPGQDQHALACVFAHPDDETYSSAATLARHEATGAPCHLLCATDGDAGRRSSIPVTSRTELGILRRAELRAAAGILGIQTVHSLGLPDGALPQADADALLAEIVHFIRAHRPAVVITFGPEGGPNAHRDHKVISRLTTAAFFLAAMPTAWPEQLSDGALRPHKVRRLYYVAWEPPQPGAAEPYSVPITALIDGRPWERVKRSAFEAHRTQLSLRHTFEWLAMTDQEGFALATGEPQTRSLTDDLFEGL